MDDILCSYSDGVSELSLLEDMARATLTAIEFFGKTVKESVFAPKAIDIDLEIDKHITILHKPQLVRKPRKLRVSETLKKLSKLITLQNSQRIRAVSELKDSVKSGQRVIFASTKRLVNIFQLVLAPLLGLLFSQCPCLQVSDAFVQDAIRQLLAHALWPNCMI